MELGHGDVRLVDHAEEVVREVVEERVGGRSGRPPVDVPGVVLDAVAETHLAEHLEVVLGAHPQPLGLEELALGLQHPQPVRELRLDAGHRPLHPGPGGHVVGGGVDDHLLQLGEHLTGQRVETHQPLDRVAEQLGPEGGLLVGGENVDGVAAHPELPPGEAVLAALVGHVDQPAQDRLLRVVDAQVEPEQVALVLLG